MRCMSTTGTTAPAGCSPMASPGSSSKSTSSSVASSGSPRGASSSTREFEVGRDATLDALRQRHDSILIATGVYKPRAIKAPGVGAAGIVEALDYLTASNRKGFGDAVPDSTAAR